MSGHAAPIPDVIVRNPVLKALLHVVFGGSAAGSLRQVLSEDRRAEKVACLQDDLSFGPFGQDDGAARIQWVEEVFGIEWEDIVIPTSSFLTLSCSSDVMPIVWISRRDAREYAGFLWWLSHLGDAPCSIVDVTDLTSNDYPERLVVSSSSLPAPEMRKLLGREAPLLDTDRTRYREQWQKLTTENAPLRVIDQPGSLVSAPLDYLDPVLLACATADWRKMARIIGEALRHFSEQDLHQAGDLFLAARTIELAEVGKLEWRGDLYAGLHHCEVRLPPDRQPG
jgi:hypothetical protein